MLEDPLAVCLLGSCQEGRECPHTAGTQSTGSGVTPSFPHLLGSEFTPESRLFPSRGKRGPMR